MAKAATPNGSDDFEGWLAAFRAASEKRQRATAHRKVPMPPPKRGFCKWCLAELKRLKSGKVNPSRSWCRHNSEGRDCWHQFALHSVSVVQYDHLCETHGEKCADCGALAPKIWRNLGLCNYGGWYPPMPWVGERRIAYFEARQRFHMHCRAWFPHWGEATMVERVSALQVDHIIPLWSLRGVAERWHFGPRNLQLLCTACHKAKTKREAAERAALRKFETAQGILI